MSLAHRIIPCLDTDGSRVVKGVHFEALRDAGDPVELAARYNAEGADELVVLDIAAARDNRPTFLETIRSPASISSSRRPSAAPSGCRSSPPAAQNFRNISSTCSAKGLRTRRWPLPSFTIRCSPSAS